MKLKIRSKLLISFAFLLILSSLIEVFTFNLTRDYILTQTGNSEAEKAQSAANTINDFFGNIQSYSNGLAKKFIASNGSGTDLQNIASYVLNSNELIRKITFLSTTGKELVKIDQSGQTPIDKLSYEISSDQFIQAVSGKTSISKVYVLTGQHGPYIDMFVPIDQDKKVVGVIKMQISLIKLWTIISDVKLGEHGFAYIVDDEGRLIAHPNQQLVLERPNLSSRKVISSLLNPSEVTPPPSDYEYTNEKNVKVVSRAVRIGEVNWFVIFEEPLSEAYSFLDFIRNMFIFTFLGSFFVLLLISLFVSENLTSSIRKLQIATQQLEKGNLANIISIQSGDEIESLSSSFNLMARQLLQREYSLKKEKKETETLLQSLTDAVVAVDENNAVFMFNKAAEKLTGIVASFALGRNIDVVLQFYDSNRQILYKEYRQAHDETIEKLKEKGLVVKTQSGKRIAISLTTAPIAFEDISRNGWMLTFQDISKEKELEEMKIDFVSMAAHELRTPLTAIRGYTSLLQTEEKEISPQGKDYINKLVISGENLGDLIDNLLNVSRIERNTFKVETTPTDIIPAIEKIIANLNEQANTKHQTLTFIPPLTKIPLVMADNFRITQVLSNLIANAINYTPEWGKISVSVKENIHHLFEVTVSDNGIGIPEEALPKLFTKFFRVSGKLEQGSKGTGLGLFISKSIINMHHGDLWVKSKLGEGSTFYFTLPYATANDIEEYEKSVSKRTLTGKNLKGIIINKERFEKRFGKQAKQPETDPNNSSS